MNSGFQRFTFGIPELSDGIGFVPVAMGLFGITNTEDFGGAPVEKSIRQTFREKIKAMKPFFRSLDKVDVDYGDADRCFDVIRAVSFLSRYLIYTIPVTMVLGFGFALESAAPVVPTLDVILTQTTSALTPKQADFLAQASNQGGGEHDKASRPRDNQTGPIAQVQPGVAPRPLRAQAPTPQPAPRERVVSSSAGEAATPTPRATPTPTTTPLPRGPEKVERDMAMARLAAEIHLRSERYAKRPKRKFVSASTKEYVYANYLRAWVDRAERVVDAQVAMIRSRLDPVADHLELIAALAAAGRIDIDSPVAVREALAVMMARHSFRSLAFQTPFRNHGKAEAMA